MNSGSGKFDGKNRA